MINYISPEKIEIIAEKLLNDVFSSGREIYSHIDIIKIADKLNCRVEIVDFEPKEIYANIIRNSSESKYTIQISRIDSKKRQRFSIAHEISHIILHDTKQEDDDFLELRQSPLNYNPEDLYKETQANTLASAILLPKKEVIAAWKSVESIGSISDMFNVSREVTFNRLSNLGILEDEWHQ